MLSAYRRHRKNCPNVHDRVAKKGCRCVWWATGTLEGRPYRKSLKTANHERAEQIMREIEAGTFVPKKAAPTILAFDEASQRFIRKLQAENRAPDTIRKYRLLFSELAPHGRLITDFTVDTLSDFRAEWQESPVTRNKKLDRLKSFFRYAHDAGWISHNPTKLLKPASVRDALVQPFSPNQQSLLLTKPQTRILRCFVRILFYSGLRISDACMLRPEDFDGNRIRRVNQKNNETVFIPIPPDLKAELDLLSLNSGYYFLRGQSEKHYTQSDAWRTILNDTFKESIPDFHPHRFRHTAAVNWLASGLSMEEVAALLGNSVKIVEKHYASFCPARQETLERKLSQAWSTKLVRVK
jgi:integrase/recombinase XerD